MFGISAGRAGVSMADFYAGLHPDDRRRRPKPSPRRSIPARGRSTTSSIAPIGKEDGVIRWVAAKGAACSTTRAAASG